MESEAGIESTLDSQHPVTQDQSILSRNDIGESSRLVKGRVRGMKNFGFTMKLYLVCEKNDSGLLTELSSNFSTKLSFEIGDLSELKGANIKATQEEMLRTGEEEELTLPDLQYLHNEQCGRVKGLLKSFKNLFMTRMD